MPAGAEADILKGLYLFKKGGEAKTPRVQLMGSGTIFREVIAAAELLKADWGVESDIWGAPSFNELARNGHDIERWNLLHPMEEPKKTHVQQKLAGFEGPIIAATDYIRMFPRADPLAARSQLRHAGHRRLRPLRHPRAAAPLLRGGSPLGDAGGAQGAGRRGHDRPRQGRRGDGQVPARPVQAEPDVGLSRQGD
jgi:hypothetical protein